MTEAEDVMALGQLCLDFAHVDRITYCADGVTLESDTDHTVMLGLIGCAFAAAYLPQLDVGLVAQFALVHDFVEVYAGDTPTLKITASGRSQKAAREETALERLRDEFQHSFPWLIDAISEYEKRIRAEARYVKALDKLLPKITHVLNGGVTFREQGMSQADVARRYVEQLDELYQYASDFPPLLKLRIQLINMVLEMCFA